MHSLKYLLIPFTLFAVEAVAQNTTSPYSILGIGDIETKDFGRWYGMGSTSVALTNPYYINASNPASLMGLSERMMNFDLANRGKSSRFMYPGSDTLTKTSKDFSVRRISLAFKANKNWAFSAGLKPYSTINFLLLETNNYFNNSTSLAKSVDGSGGLNQLYFSYARRLSKHLNVGLTSSYFFGSASINTQYYGAALNTTLEKQQYDVMNGYQFQAGLQYEFNSSKILKHRLGLTVSNPTTIKRRTDLEYLNSSVSIKKATDTKNDFRLPLSVSAGYALIIDDDLTISAEGMYSNWKKQSLDYPNSYTTPSGRISAGAEYVYRKKIGSYWVENWYLQGGITAEKTYQQVSGANLNTYAVTAGVGKNLSALISVYTGFEYGNKGSIKYGLIKEQFTQYIIGFTLKEFWFNFKKYGRFQ